MKLDWLKAVKERPEDAAKASAYMVLGGILTEDIRSACRRLREAASVQSVEGADRALADWLTKFPIRPELETDGAHARKLINACREARAREAAEEESHKKGGSCWGGQQ